MIGPVLFYIAIGAILAYVASEPGLLATRDPDGRPIELSGWPAIVLAVLIGAIWPLWLLLLIAAAIAWRRRP
jgi:hypothetical protein